ncbi:MAG: hypothetical protein ABI723_15045 [Bacteroidia bacterium]
MNENEIKKIRLLVKAEPIIILVIVIGACFKLMHWDGAATLLIISISTLAISYMFSAFIPSESKNTASIFINKLGNIGLAMALVGILFKLMIWEGNAMQLIGGITAISCCLIAILYLRNQADNENSFSSKQIARLIVIGSIAGFFAAVSERDIMNFNHADDPEYVRLFFNMREHPKDTEAREAFEKYRKEKFENARKSDSNK